MRDYYQMSVSNDGRTGEIDIYGDITQHRSWGSAESDVNAYGFARDLEAMGPVDYINVHINSCGGSVWEGIAIYNLLRRHKARVTTTCDGSACSIASVVFMAGDERIVYPTSMLMVHNAWTSAFGVNAADLRKLADDMDAITSQSKAAYMACLSITEEELTALMDAETFIRPADAVAMGFATRLDDHASDGRPAQSAWGEVFDRVYAVEASPKPAAHQQPQPSPAPEPPAQQVEPAAEPSAQQAKAPTQPEPPAEPAAAEPPAAEPGETDKASEVLASFFSA